MAYPTHIGLTNFIEMSNKARIKVEKPVLFAMVNRYSNSYPVTRLCKTLGVSRSGYYKWIAKQSRPDHDLAIRDEILKIQQNCDFTIGHRRMVKYLKDECKLTVNHKKVFRIMKKFGLLSRVRG